MLDNLVFIAVVLFGSFYLMFSTRWEEQQRFFEES
jgi:hypothetical protein